jgi:hypothetical protein
MLAVTIEPMTTMKNNIILVLLALLLHSCNYAQELKVNSEIQDFFDVKGNVKEITTTKKNFTTMGEKNMRVKLLSIKKENPLKLLIMTKTEMWKVRNPGQKLMKMILKDGK